MVWRTNVLPLDDWNGNSKSFFLFMALMMTSLSAVFSLGEFQLVLRSFQNDLAIASNSNCCSSTGFVTSSTKLPVCRQPCRTFFRICFSHYQAIIPLDPPCTYGLTITDVLGYSTFNLSSSNGTGFMMPFDFNFTWTGSFTLVIEAFHDMTGGQPYEGSARKLIARTAIQRLLAVGQNWVVESYTDALTQTSLTYEYRVVCLKTYYGPGCVQVCAPRDDLFGHYDCDDSGQKICKYGWTGSYCESPVCLDGCNVTYGSCSSPFECRCKYGWEGRFCDKCIKYPNCSQGNCSLPWQCNCFSGWGGQLCNVDLDYCSHNSPCKNGGTCWNNSINNYTCQCLPGFEGRNCDAIATCTQSPCQNGGTCQGSPGNYTCLCPNGHYGPLCEHNSDSRVSRDFTTQSYHNFTTSNDALVISSTGRANSSDPSAVLGQSDQLTFEEIILIAVLGGGLPTIIVVLVCIICFVLKRRRSSKQTEARKSESCAKTVDDSRRDLGLKEAKLNNISNELKLSDVLSAERNKSNRVEVSPIRQSIKVPNVNLNRNSLLDPVREAHQIWTRDFQPESSSRFPETQSDQYLPSLHSLDSSFPDILNVTDFVCKHPLQSRNQSGLSKSHRPQPQPTVEYDFVSVVARWRYNYPPDILSTDV